MKGTLYGIGTGPGDPEEMTLKAVRTIKQCDVIVLPIADFNCLKEPKFEPAGEAHSQELLEKCVAFRIAKENVPEMIEKAFLFLPMPMLKEKEVLKKVHDAGTDALKKLLEQRMDAGFLTLGDPSIYSTYLYVHKRLHKAGYPVQMISGIPSFCAAAAKLGEGLVENRTKLHIIPASYQMEEAMRLDGTKILMKAGRQMPKVKALLKEQNQHATMVENCGMAGEKVYKSTKEIPNDSGYFSLIIVKEDKK